MQTAVHSWARPFRSRGGAGSEHFRLGAELAARHGHLFEEARLLQQLFRNKIRFLGLHHAIEDLEGLRRKIHHIGSPSLALCLQVGLTELATKLSLLPSARRHLEIGRALLPKVTERAYIIPFLHTEVALTFEEGDSAEALRLALALVEDQEGEPPSTNLAGTIGHLLLVQSQFTEAEQWLRRALETAPKNGGRCLAIL